MVLTRSASPSTQNICFFLWRNKKNVTCMWIPALIRTYYLAHLFDSEHHQSDRKAWANCVDPDQTPLSVAFDQGLHSLTLIQQMAGLGGAV